MNQKTKEFLEFAKTSVAENRKGRVNVPDILAFTDNDEGADRERMYDDGLRMYQQLVSMAAYMHDTRRLPANFQQLGQFDIHVDYSVDRDAYIMVAVDRTDDRLVAQLTITRDTDFTKLRSFTPQRTREAGMICVCGIPGCDIGPFVPVNY